MKKSAWTRIAEMLSHGGKKSDETPSDTRGTTNLVVGVGREASRYGARPAETVEFHFNFDPDDTVLPTSAGKRMKCPCCEDEFEALLDGVVACPQCIGAMQSKHLGGWHVYSEYQK
jgi:hypothetical protein